MRLRLAVVGQGPGDGFVSRAFVRALRLYLLRYFRLAGEGPGACALRAPLAPQTHPLTHSAPRV